MNKWQNHNISYQKIEDDFMPEKHQMLLIDN